VRVFHSHRMNTPFRVQSTDITKDADGLVSSGHNELIIVREVDDSYISCIGKI
jgi:hypothetical protein